ncbi:MAG: hypothetical protein IIA49_15925, partial [Bacteroidetes bacterium]|nr:hypothetical protein [Bacteroidota bacterium]
TINIYTLGGKLVKKVLNSFQSAGTVTATWDGTADNGSRVASGTYAVHIKGPKVDTIIKVVVIK